MKPYVTSLDHLVLTVRNIKKTVQFYTEILGMRAETFMPVDGSIRTALTFGTQKINLHQSGAEFDPKADIPTPGSADLCFLSEHPLSDWVTHLMANDVPIMEGPVQRTGATGPITSLYIRDPDGNLVEISNLVCTD